MKTIWMGLAFLYSIDVFAMNYYCRIYRWEKGVNGTLKEKDLGEIRIDSAKENISEFPIEGGKFRAACIGVQPACEIPPQRGIKCSVLGLTGRLEQDRGFFLEKHCPTHGPSPSFDGIFPTAYTYENAGRLQLSVQCPEGGCAYTVNCFGLEEN